MSTVKCFIVTQIKNKNKLVFKRIMSSLLFPSIKGLTISSIERKHNFLQGPCCVCPMQSASTAISGVTAIILETSLQY